MSIRSVIEKRAILVNLIRSVGRYNSAGEWELMPEPPVKIRAMIQPSGEEALQLPEEFRNKDAISIYSTQTLKPVSNGSLDSADVVVFESKEYTVIKVFDYFRLGGYYMAIGVKRAN